MKEERYAIILEWCGNTDGHLSDCYAWRFDSCRFHRPFSLGHAGFMAIGAYGTALSIKLLHMPFFPPA